MSSKIVFGSICIITMFLLFNCNKQCNKKTTDNDSTAIETPIIEKKLSTTNNSIEKRKKQTFTKINYESKKYNSFLQPIEPIEYVCDDLIIDFHLILNDHEISYNEYNLKYRKFKESVEIDIIRFVCVKEDIKFVINIHKSQILFISDNKDITNLINKIME